MNKEKQINEMADIITKTCENKRLISSMSIANSLYNKDYRKECEIAKQIIADIDNRLHDMAMEYYNAGRPEYFAVCQMVYHKVIRPFEKKYTGE